MRLWSGMKFASDIGFMEIQLFGSVVFLLMAGVNALSPPQCRFTDFLI